MDSIVSILRESWSVVEEAPFAVLLLVLLSGTIGYRAHVWFQSGREETLRERLKYKDEQIAGLEEKLASQALEAPATQTDPDAITQHGHVVGKMIAPRVEMSQGNLYATEIRGNENFNREAPFQFREHRLRVKSASVVSTVSGVLGVGTSLRDVVCTIEES
ncbi:hypothetical protein AADZ90_021445 [Aestuariibius sp. 2305UL40-4]|uniref:hypothetical protein n=1 Tax=Aestuariibius violaceus TaxID=3234132 RepID=UPI00345E19BF